MNRLRRPPALERSILKHLPPGNRNGGRGRGAPLAALHSPRRRRFRSSPPMKTHRKSSSATNGSKTTKPTKNRTTKTNRVPLQPDDISNRKISYDSPERKSHEKANHRNRDSRPHVLRLRIRRNLQGLR